MEATNLKKVMSGAKKILDILDSEAEICGYESIISLSKQVCGETYYTAEIGIQKGRLKSTLCLVIQDDFDFYISTRLGGIDFIVSRGNLSNLKGFKQNFKLVLSERKE